MFLQAMIWSTKLKSRMWCFPQKINLRKSCWRRGRFLHLSLEAFALIAQSRWHQQKFFILSLWKMMLSLLKVRWGCLILLLKLARVYVELKLLLQSAFQGIFILLFNGITKIKTIGKEVVLYDWSKRLFTEEETRQRNKNTSCRGSLQQVRYNIYT